MNRSQLAIEDLRSDELFKKAKPDPAWIDFVKEETKKEVERVLSAEKLVDFVEPIGFLIDRLCVENIKVFVFETKIRDMGSEYGKLRGKLDSEMGPEFSDTPEMSQLQKDIAMFVNLSRQANDNRVAYKNAITKKFKEIKDGKDKGLIETRTWNG